ncbi:MAG: hypothetical protein ACTS1Z_11750 [Parasphingopyxis sp.]
MALLSALFLLAAAPEAGAVAQARATARIVAAEEIDFSRFEAPPSSAITRLFRIERHDVDADRREALRLIEFH